FNKYGTNYLWNEAASRQRHVSNAGSVWLMIEITSLYPELPMPHTGGYGILYADGHAAIGRDFSFPSFERPALASNISTEKQKEESAQQEKEESQEEKPVSKFDSYSIINISPRVQAGKPISIAIRAIDAQGKTYESNEKLRIIDLTQTVEPSEVFLQNGIANTMVIFKKAHASNVLTVINSEGKWNSSNEFVVEPAQPASIEIVPPDLVYAGDVANFRIVLRDVYGNIVLKEGIGVLVFVGTQADYPGAVVSDAAGQIVVPVIFRKTGEAKITFAIKGTIIKESCSIRVRPGPVDRFEISEIKSPVEAGKAIPITIKALDRHGNRTKGFMFSLDKNIPVYVQEDMSSGIWMESIKFEKAVSETFIEVSDGMGHTGRSNFFSVVPSYPKEMKLLSENLVVIEGQESDIEFSVFDRFGNYVPELESKFQIEGVTEYKVSKSQKRYVLTVKFNNPGKKNVKISLNLEDSRQLSLEFFVDVLSRKPVLKRGE
ncbi:MAG: hypothetical protein NC830_00995, partial [Candidatus Omnitrophica bacterium]|nr:hypothetical protein [Candidatus Omnitrophota bacterium]